MNDFESLMNDVFDFVGIEKSEEMIKTIKKTTEGQRKYQSGHKYNLDKFGLTEKKIKTDCKHIYETFLP